MPTQKLYHGISSLRYFHCSSRLLQKSLLVEVGNKWFDKTINAEFAKKWNADNAKKKYILSMFPYPSGMLHIGHLRVYVISDTLNRFYKQNKYHVIHPMGWDAFGLPAENAAIERGISPSAWTESNIAKMKEQMNTMLANFDWDREINTSDPEYYKFTQFIFLQLFKHNMAYQKEAEINWDPVDRTVLANEQVDSEGKSWRSGAIVEKKMLKQWFLGITKFAKELNQDLKSLDQWPSKVKSMQSHWIGESKGTSINFETNIKEFPKIEIFTTRAETIFAVQYLALSLQHEIARNFASTDPNLKMFLKTADSLPENSKAGYLIPDINVINPITGAKIPVYVSPYVLSNYGPGAVMGCPGHDERDAAFWKGISPKNEFITCYDSVSDKSNENSLGQYLPDGIMNQSVGAEFGGISTVTCRKKITKMLEKMNKGKFTVNYKLRDWLISRQRYWGTPIPIIHCDDCGPVPVPEEDLPVILPKVDALKKKGNPLTHISKFVDVNCPSCGKHAKRETDTMDTFIDSSWYFLRYLDNKNKDLPFSKNVANKLMPIDLYVGGVEHAILHLLYSRFISKFLGSVGFWNGKQCLHEPFEKLVTQGMVHGKTFVNPKNGRFLKQDELEFSDSTSISPRIKKTGETPITSFEKMSKSKYNGVDPVQFILKHGPDATRAHVLFQAPIENTLTWDSDKIVGTERWLTKLINLTKALTVAGKFDSNYASPTDMNLTEAKFHNEIQNYIKSVTTSFEISLSLNTVISDYMKVTNAIEYAFKQKTVRLPMLVQNMQKLISMIYPVAPSVCEECSDILKTSQNWEWNQYSWPKVEGQIIPDEKEYLIFINGKMKFKYVASKNFFQEGQEAIYNSLLQTSEGQKHMNNKLLKKAILKNSMINFIFQKET